MTLSLIITGLAVLVLLLISGFFSGSETAITAASRARMHLHAKQGDKRAKRVLKLLDRKEQLIGAVLLGNNLVNILASALTTSLLVGFFGDAGVAYATLGLTLIVVIFAETLPKSYAISHPDRVAQLTSFPLSVAVWLLTPVAFVVGLLVRGIMRLFGIGEDTLSTQHHEEELRGAIDLHQGDEPEIAQERLMLKSILDLDDITIEDVMTHRRRVEMFNIADPAPVLVEKMLASSHTRIPLYREDPDNIVGVVHAKELLKALHDKSAETLDLGKLANAPWFVPEGNTLMDQLLAFRERREHFAVVVDEYGALMGIVTLEDILEEIVGNIDDETDILIKGVKPQGDGSYIIEGSATLRELSRDLDWDLEHEEAATLAGLLLHEARRVPEKGQKFLFQGFRFEVLRRVRNQITEIRVIPPVSAPEKDG